ncbi:hypothetical protein DL89DRAFT_84373 [Linderina pennispora]|uniref:Uncharacterized protein n=1 Tax=Linderina pennispora TaxID=61395 RepID=A0A1Y1WHT5_9FUNG|nr:uncharacterized protein DL89DRAFT_84373 [Linderina pennispora]ORX72898.1 hypothetical protein DL89DRAFT_84373 [Linderina pennispora]
MVTRYLRKMVCTVSEQHISVDECRRLFDGNDGVIDLLLRYYDRLCIALCSDVPAGQSADSRLSETALRTLEQVHEAIIDWTNDSLMSGMSPMDYEKAIRYGLVALQLLSGVLIRQLLPSDMYQCMRAEWIRTTDSVLQSAMREQVYQNLDLEYRIAKEWADYELAVVSNDVDLAEQHIARCEELFDTLQTQQGDGSWMGSTKCAFSGEPVTLKLVKSRRGHIASFQALVKAESALASDKEGAARRLESIVRTFTAGETAGGYFSFVQKIATVRLLASIYNEQSQTGNEARLVVIELFLYMERLVAECGDSDSDTASVPLRPIVGRCVDCLQRLGEIAQDDSQVWEELARMLDTAFFSTSCMQMLALSLEVAAYFSVDQPAESPLAVSPEATLSVMATWLVAKLSADIPALPVAEEFACVPPNCSDEAVDEKAAVSDTGAEPTADPPQARG